MRHSYLTSNTCVHHSKRWKFKTAWLFLFIGVFCSTLATNTYAASKNKGRIYVITQTDQPLKSQVVAFVDELKARSAYAEIQMASLDHLLKESTSLTNTDLIIAVGPVIFDQLIQAEIDATLLSVYTSRTLFDSIIQNKSLHHETVSAVYADPNPKDQISLFAGIYPKNKHIGVLLSKASLQYRTLIQRAAEYSNVEVSFEVLQETGNALVDVKSAIQRLYKRGVASVLAIPDYQVYNPQSIKSILLTTYRYGIPVIGFSKAFVKRGAVASIHYEPSHVAAEVVDIYRRFLELGRLGPASYPENLNVVINKGLARSLELYKNDTQSLLSRIKKQTLISDKAFQFVLIDDDAKTFYETLL